MQTIKLNLIPGSVLPVVNVSQYDAHRQFQLVVYEGATAYNLTGKTVEIRGTKPDGNGFAYDATDGVVSVSGNTVTISTTQQMTAVGGQTMAELRITSGSTVLGTLNFVLDVEHSALSDDTPISETDIPAIERDFEAALEEAEADALVAEGYAKGTQGGVPVTSESPYYNNNAEHFKDEAEAAASDVLEKYPKIVNDYWYVWDIDTNQYVNTGVRAKGTQGDPGAPGQGVPAGGTTGQVLKKASDSDYDTEWGTGGGGASALDDLTDVSITSAADGDLLQYNGASQEWGNSSAVPDAIDALEETGAVNLLPNNAVSQVSGGVTWTKNEDGTVTPTGSPSSNSDFVIYGTSASSSGSIALPDGIKAGKKYIASINNAVPSNAQGQMKFYFYDASLNMVLYKGVNFSQAEVLDIPDNATRVFVELYFASSWAISAGTKFYPQVVPYGMGDKVPYQPYAMTNRELTEQNTPNSSSITSINTNSYYSLSGTGYLVKNGHIAELYMQIKCNSVSSSWVEIISMGVIPIPFGAAGGVSASIAAIGGGTAIDVNISPTGKLLVSSGQQNKYYNILFTYIC